jgi:cell division transport system permease protein
MTISTAIRHVREGGKSLLRNGWMTFASISAISISLFILGVFLLLSLNVNYLAQQIEKQVEIRVYLDINTPADQVQSLQKDIAQISGVSKITFVSKDEGMKFLRERLGENGKALLEGFDGENNPLNDSYTVEVADPHTVPQVAAQISALNDGKNPKPIYKVSYGQGTVETLFRVTAIVRNIGLVLVAGLALTAMFLIANTIKLTIMARNREIAIMKLVGATNSFIRWPFFIEGALLGLIGSIIPVAILLYGYWRLVGSSQLELSLLMVKLKPFSEIQTSLTLLLLGIGIVIGIWGTLLSVRKFLRV